ncbi:hypothetical protein B296_00032427 [Ensete ventricosum]|uniref:Uncharacterized protein n=1 Tax=Ensete ventricosum TaxID=4639 RepID=A0A426Y6U7_ENSVE|nr:hypothetical protein B296_00032427 [Ensete ventricosum]
MKSQMIRCLARASPVEPGELPRSCARVEVIVSRTVLQPGSSLPGPTYRVSASSMMLDKEVAGALEAPGRGSTVVPTVVWFARSTFEAPLFLEGNENFDRPNHKNTIPLVALSNGNNGSRPVLSREALLHKPCIGYENVAGTRGYLTSLGANKAVGFGNRLSDWRFLLANPNFRRFFSSGNPNKKSK